MVIEMDVGRSLRYFGGVDLINAAHMREAAVYIEHGLDPDKSIPVDAGFDGGAEIIGIRVLTIIKHVGAVMCRATDVDAAYRIVTRTDFPE